ncbi:MAG: magnesium chelatase, partial [Myxococcota bacterium]
HNPATLEAGVAITRQEAWTARGAELRLPQFIREVVEGIAFAARREKKIDKRSRVSQRLPLSALENAVSNAERRALLRGESVVAPRIADVYAALPSMTGKFELEYEGELKGAETIARELIRAAVANVADGYLAHLETRQVVEWFDLGGSLQLADTMSAADVIQHAGQVQGLVELAQAAGVPKNAPKPMLAAAIDFALEGLYALKKISRSEERGYHASDTPVRRPSRQEREFDENTPVPGGQKKKYYN